MGFGQPSITIVNGNKRTGNLFWWAAPPLSFACLVGDMAVFDVMQLATTCSAYIAFPWFTPAGVADRVFHGTVANEVASLGMINRVTVRTINGASQKTHPIAYPAYIPFMRLLPLWAVRNEVLRGRPSDTSLRGRFERARLTSSDSQTLHL